MSNNTSTPEFEALLEYLQRTRGFDFTAYKRASLIRRIQKRMRTVNIEHYDGYVDYLEVHPEEFAQLFNTILINVTAFFRDEPAWQFVTEQIVPQIIAHKRPRDPIRLWSAGCASGEEAYTLAMVFAEALGLDQFRTRVKIYATDADEEALNQARQATYTLKQVEGVPPALIEKCFDQVNGRFVFNKELRRLVIFGRHDLVQDAPISKVDLLVCRNTLMYFNAEAQEKILTRFAFAVNDGGYVFLGKAEALLSRVSMFTPVDMKRRVFMRVPRGDAREHVLAAAQINGEEDVSSLAKIREAAFDADPVAQVVVDQAGTLMLANETARSLFGLRLEDLNRPLQDLELSYRPLELRSLLVKALAERRAISIKDVDWPMSSGATHVLDVQVLPLMDAVGNVLGAKIIFIDVTRFKRLQTELQQSHVELEAANEELQSANEELETTNEELQSTVEELETTNEELQSTNEELETMNEELQSTNAELQASNEQLHERSAELDQLNTFFISILTSLPDGVIVVDRDLRVHAWNQRAEDMWGLRSEEARGQHLLNLDIGLPVAELRQPIRLCLNGEGQEQVVTLNATNRRGKAISVKVTCTPLDGSGKEAQGVILLVEEKKE